MWQMWQQAQDDVWEELWRSGRKRNYRDFLAPQNILYSSYNLYEFGLGMLDNLGVKWEPNKKRFENNNGIRAIIKQKKQRAK